MQQPVSRRSFHRSGTAGWAVTAAFVLAWDFAGPETMSEAFRRSRGSPAGRAASVIAWGYLTAHLFEVIPREADPLDILHQAWVKHRHGLAA